MYLYLNTCVFIFVDIVLEGELRAQMVYWFLILINVTWLLSRKAVNNSSFVSSCEGIFTSIPSNNVLFLFFKAWLFNGGKVISQFYLICISPTISEFEYIFLDHGIFFWGIYFLISLAHTLGVICFFLVNI